ncbi:hypothetical protein [Haliscomenobacter sp.]|uniref:hypothetical protein n=1 Tax=Haliscomenobacter sp. TaxID=2717303 RepID=UPI003593EF42
MTKKIFEEVRALIGSDKIHEAFLTVKHLELNQEYLNDLILLENQLNNWEHRFRMNIGTTDTERNRITYGLLATLSKIEGSNQKSTKNHKQYEVESLLERTFHKLAELESPSNQTEHILKQLERSNPERYKQLKNLSIQLKKNQNLPNNIDNIIQFFGRQLGSVEQLTEHDANIIIQLLLKNPATLIATLNDKRHKEASIGLLEKQIAALKAKYEKIKIAGIASIAGALSTALFFNTANESVFGKGYDENAYNMNGYDPDGFNRSGFDRNGQHFLGEELSPEDFDDSNHDDNDDFDDEIDAD